MRVLLDSCTLIDYLNGVPQAIETVNGLKREGAAIHTSTLNIYEVRCGIETVRKNQERQGQALDLICANLRVLPFDGEAARKAAEIWARQRSIGKPLDGLDPLIAGCAIANGIDAIVTRNKKHFDWIFGSKKVVVY